MRTIRSAARSRNRGRPGLAWIIVGALTLLALAAGRAAAAPTPARVEERDTCVGDAVDGLLDGDGDVTDEGDEDSDDEDDQVDDHRDVESDDRCHRGADGAFDYLDEFALRGADDANLDAAETLDLLPWERDASHESLDADDVAALYEPLLHDADAIESLEASAFDDPLVREAIETGSAFSSSSFADATELEDLDLRHQRPSRWGRLDLTIAWRRAWTPQPVTVSLGPLPHGPIAQSYDTADHVLVLATWSR